MIGRAWRGVRRDLLERQTGGFPALDGIRAVAVLLVIFFHGVSWLEFMGDGMHDPQPNAGLRWFLGTLWVGVDVFFVLSGFLIGRILLLQHAAGRVDYAQFYIRRAARIFPAYYLVLAVAVFALSRLEIFVIMFHAAPLGTVLRQSLFNFVYLNNYVQGDVDVMGWTWSLCVEEHFYVVLPMVLALLFRLRPYARVGVLVALALVPMLFRLNAFVHNPSMQLWGPVNVASHTRCDGLVFGVLIAYAYVFHRPALEHVVARWRAPMLGAALACYAMMFVWGGVFQTGMFAVVAQFFVIALGAALLVATNLGGEHRLTRLLSHRVWYPIARVSYGMYLVHPFLILWLISRLLPVPRSALHSAPELLALCAVAVLCSFVAASLLFLMVELPILRWARRRTAR